MDIHRVFVFHFDDVQYLFPKRRERDQGCIDDMCRTGTYTAHEISLFFDCLDQRKPCRQRMLAAGLAVAADQYLIIGLEEDDTIRTAEILDLC